GTDNPCLFGVRSCGMAQKLAFQPGDMLFSKTPGLKHGAASWNRHACNAVRAQSQYIASRAPMPHEGDRQLPVANLQQASVRHQPGRRSKTQLKLHLIKVERFSSRNPSRLASSAWTAGVCCSPVPSAIKEPAIMAGDSATWGSDCRFLIL